MTSTRIGKDDQGKVAHPRNHHKKVNSPISGSESSRCKDVGKPKTSDSLNIEASDFRAFLKEVIGEAIRDYFHDPQNIATESATLPSKKKRHSSIGPRRDISNDEIIRPRDLPQATGLSRTQIWRLSKADQFVKKIRLSNNCVGFLRSDIELWLATRQTI